jgi:hypothetical protein
MVAPARVVPWAWRCLACPPRLAIEDYRGRVNAKIPPPGEGLRRIPTAHAPGRTTSLNQTTHRANRTRRRRRYRFDLGFKHAGQPGPCAPSPIMTATPLPRPWQPRHAILATRRKAQRSPVELSRLSRLEGQRSSRPRQCVLMTDPSSPGGRSGDSRNCRNCLARGGKPGPSPGCRPGSPRAGRARRR